MITSNQLIYLQVRCNDRFVWHDTEIAHILVCASFLFFTDKHDLKNKKPTENEYVTIVNELNPVHHCFNAFQRDSRCDFALCNKCKLHYENEEYQGGGKRTRSAYRTVNDVQYKDDITALKKSFTNRYQACTPCLADEIDVDCDHKLQNLKFTVDETIFESSFLAQVKKNKLITEFLLNIY